MSRFSFVIYFLSIMLFAMPQFAHAGEKEQANRYIQTLADKTLGIIQTNKTRETKQKELETLFSSSVDLKWVGRFVMGRYWRKASDEQKKRYLKAYEEFVLGHYATRFTEYSSGKFAITGTTKLDDEGEYLISMELLNSGDTNGQPVLVDYKVRKNGKGFLVFDVIIEGVSMITTQRSEFSSVISRHNIEYLIEQLASKSLPTPGA